MGEEGIWIQTETVIITWPVHVAVPFKNKYQNTTCSICGFPVDDMEQHVQR